MGTPFSRDFIIPLDFPLIKDYNTIQRSGKNDKKNPRKIRETKRATRKN